MGQEFTKTYKRISKELAAAGVSTKSVTSEDGSSLSMRSADELEKLLALAKEADAAAAGGGKIRMVRTRAPGAY